MPPRTTNTADAMFAIEHLGWALGPTIEAEAWRSSVKKDARAAGIKLATGKTDEGLPWAARTDLTAQQETDLRTPWGLMGVTARSFFNQYPPPLVDPERLATPGRETWLPSLPRHP